MEEAKLRNSCLSAFRLCGLNVQHDAIAEVVNYLRFSRLSETDQIKQLNRIVDTLLKQSLTTTLVDKNTLERAIEDYNQQSTTGTGSLLSVISAFDVPKFEFLERNQGLYKNSSLAEDSRNLLGTVNDRINVYRNRYELILQRLIRHEYFAASVGVSGAKFELKTVESLLALPEEDLQNCVCLAAISQLKPNKYYLEDPTGFVEVDLKNARFQSGLFTENCFVLAEGCFVDGVLKASAVGLPPIESAEKMRQRFGNENFFGGPLKICAKMQTHLQDLELQCSSAALAFLSDVFLDDAQVIEKLRQMFHGFSMNPPICFVFCGRFLSKYESAGNVQALKDGFKALVDVLLEFSSILEYSHFIFVPSLQDPLLTGIFPKAQLPFSALSPCLSKIPNYHLATNPCRLQYCTQEIIIFREDTVEKMCRNSVRLPEDVSKLQKHFVRTILSQNHLAPFSLIVSPVHWSFDRSMYLYPLPDLIVCCDRYKQFVEKSHDCIVANPGSFSNNKYAFQLYYPLTRLVDDSIVPDD